MEIRQRCLLLYFTNNSLALQYVNFNFDKYDYTDIIITTILQNNKSNLCNKCNKNINQSDICPCDICSCDIIKCPHMF